MSYLRSKARLAEVVPNDRDLMNIFAEFIRLDVANGDASKDTIKTYFREANYFLQWCDLTGLNPLAAQYKDIKHYRAYLLKDYSISSVGLKLTAVRRFYTSLVANDLITANPADGVRPPNERRDPADKINYLELEELQQLLDSLPTAPNLANLRDFLIVSIMAIQGCRTIEIHQLNVGDIKKRGQNIGLKVHSKRATRVVPLIPELATVLLQYWELLPNITLDSPLFVSVSRRSFGKRLCRRAIQAVIDKYLRECNLKISPGRIISAHSLRHTAGTLAMRGGSDLRQVQDMLGHSNPQTTAIYAHIGDRWEANPALNIGVKFFQ